MSNRLVLGGLIALLVVVLVAILIVLIGVYQQSSKPLVVVTATSPSTETLDPTIAVKATVFFSCFNAYPMDTTKQSMCSETGGFNMRTSTMIP